MRPSPGPANANIKKQFNTGLEIYHLDRFLSRVHDTIYLKIILVIIVIEPMQPFFENVVTINVTLPSYSDRSCITAFCVLSQMSSSVRSNLQIVNYVFDVSTDYWAFSLHKMWLSQY